MPNGPSGHIKKVSEMKQASILFIISSVHDAIAACGLARDLAFNTKHLRITLPEGSPGFQTLTEIR